MRKQIVLITLVFCLSILVVSAAQQAQLGTIGAVSQNSPQVKGCNNLRIGLVGASNTVSYDPNGNKVHSSMSDLIEKNCPGSKVFLEAKGATWPGKQISLVNSVLNNDNLDYVILNPSANGQWKYGVTADAYKEAAIKLAQIVKEKDSNIKVIMLTNTPAKDALTIDSKGNTITFGTPDTVNRINNFNSDLLNNQLGRPDLIDYAVDTYSATEDPPGSNSCGKYCPSDHLHFTVAGREAVVKAIIDKVFSTKLNSESGVKGEAKTNIKGCLDDQRCKEIDLIWVGISKLIGVKSLVWDYQTKSWKNYNDVYYTAASSSSTAGKTTTAPTSTSTSTTSSTGKATTSFGTVSCAARVGTPEQKALLDTIAWAEGTNERYTYTYDYWQFSDTSGHPAETETKLTKGSESKVMNAMNGICANGYCSTAAGRYQFILGTYNNLKKEGFFKTGFGSEEQDKAALHLSGVTQLQLEAAISSGNFISVWDKIANKWASIPYSGVPPSTVVSAYCTNKNPPKPASACGNGHSYYGQGGKSTTKLREVFSVCLQQHKSGGAATTITATTTPSPSAGSTTSSIPTSSSVSNNNADDNKYDDCPPNMAKITGSTNYCIDQYEDTLVDKNDNKPWSPYQIPTRNIDNLKAVSVGGVIPQGYISRIDAAKACGNAGKHLCTAAEWITACNGGDASKGFPYGTSEIKDNCNYGKRHPNVITKENPNGKYSMIDPRVNQEYDLAKTGEYNKCVTPEGVYDLVGNLQEWVDDGNPAPPNKFGGGYYAAGIPLGVWEPKTSNSGCGFQMVGHSPNQIDYSLGFRCCVNLK